MSHCPRVCEYPAQHICLSTECDQVSTQHSHQYRPCCHLLSQYYVHEISCHPECCYGTGGWQQQCDTRRMVKREHLGTGVTAHPWQQINEVRETTEDTWRITTTLHLSSPMATWHDIEREHSLLDPSQGPQILQKWVVLLKLSDIKPLFFALII